MGVSYTWFQRFNDNLFHFLTQKFKNNIKLFNRILKAFDEDILDFYDGNYDFEIIWKVDW